MKDVYKIRYLKNPVLAGFHLLYISCEKLFVLSVKIKDMITINFKERSSRKYVKI